LDKVVDEAVASAEDLGAKIEGLRAERKKELEAQNAELDARFKRYSRELRESGDLLRNTLAQLSQDELAKEEEHQQTISGTQLAAMEQVAGASRSLAEMNAQVGAMREYLARQQELVKRLQEGYDWALLKAFGLRIIRCIDDIEERAARPDSAPARDALESVRDDLVFALEAGGIEQFAPEVGSEYRGNEKVAEVIRTRPASEAVEIGRIASIVRSGYQVYVSDNLTRVVRPARVEVFTQP
jgi:molecular chaperone GrpE (heat shock protein)